MASQSAAAHIMKPVVSISMSPESFSSGVTGADAALRLGALVAGSSDIPESFPDLLYGANCRSIMA